ncbi:MAG: hypothetical protein IPM81_10215 [Saprospirales bacterium]|nr:hypothetical protein [Saprospirales bacterium]
MKPSPWPLDGIKAFSGSESQSQIIKTGLIETYLSVGNHDDKFYLIGSKGLGKTTLLSYKSWLYHEQFGNAYKSNTSTDELTENLEINAKTFSKEDLFSFRSVTDWKTLWKLTLWILSFKIYGLEINPQLDEMIQKSSRLSTIFSKLLANRKKIAAFPQYINEFIENAKKIKSGVAIFIDDVDQAFEQCFLSNEHYSLDDEEANAWPAVSIWVNGQNALIAAIYAIRRQNHHIKIFATIRTEAYRCMEEQMAPNYEDHAIFLEYDKADIRDIFIKNIQLIPDEQLAYRTGQTSIEQFLGFDDEMNHRFAVDYSNEPRKESAFDFIFRHTYGRPREIVHMGKQLHGLVTQPSYHKLSRGEKIEKVRTMATQFADKLFADYRKQIIPNFDYDGKFMQFIKAVPGNVIPTEELGRLDTQTTRLYYSLGLLGRVEEYPFGKKIQRFLPAAEYNYTNLLDIPNSEFYIIHPTIDQVLLKYHTYGDFYYKYCIIGNGYPFHSPQGDMPKQRAHYIPKELSGHDGKVPADGNACSIREYYNHFFGDERIPKFYGTYVNEINLAKRVLTKLARICYFHRLNKSFAGAQYAGKIRAFTQELEDFSITRPYYNIMNEEDIDASQSKFLDKLFGRTIALGAILFLDLRFASIKKLLLTGPIDLKCEDDPDTVYQFFRRSFFIPNLSKKDQSLSNDSKLPEHRKAKQSIFDTLSAFEQDTLIELRKIVIQEVEMTSDTDLFIEPAHAEWVIQNVMNKIWNPFQ